MLARLIDRVLRSAPAMLRVPDLARETGYSRFHLTRRFREATGESLEEFVRRMRLERAAYQLTNHRVSVTQAAAGAGYRSPEAFARAFKSSYGVRPAELRGKADKAWKLPSPTNLHWNEDWTSFSSLAVKAKIVQCPAKTAAVWRVVGNYANLAKGWECLRDRFRADIPQDTRFVTVYLDNMWTHPTVDTMRADIGWLLPHDAEVPSGMRRILLPSGSYAVSSRCFKRSERNDAWSAMSGRFLAQEGSMLPSYDEYPALPLPFEQSLTRIFVGVSPSQVHLSVAGAAVE